MLTKLEARNRKGDILRLPFAQVTDGIVVAGIDGLEPVKATLSSSKFAKLKGGKFQSSNTDLRNILLHLDFKPDFVSQTATDIRNSLYKYFMPESEVNLRFYSDDEYVEINGRVESFEAPLFSEEPGAVISTLCFDPDFVDPSWVTINDATSASSFPSTELDYEGSVKTGLIFTLRADRSIPVLSVSQRFQDTETRDMHFEFTSPLLADDLLVISTIPGEKSVTLIRGGIEYSALPFLRSDSTWLELRPGMTYYTAYAAGNIGVPLTIQYQKRYGGL